MNDELNVNSRYPLLRIPILSWIALIFPLVLPPIPIGGFQFSASWDRFEEMELVKRARRFLGKATTDHGVGMQWVVNVIINLLDIASLGLRSAFMAASLADEVNVKSASSRAGQAATSHVGWLLKWVLLGNVVFLAIWVIYPGWFLLRYAASIERALYDAYQAEPLEVKVDVGTGNNQIIHATPALSADAVVQASRSGLTLLGVYTLPLAQSETTEGDDLRQGVATQVRTAAQQLLWPPSCQHAQNRMALGSLCGKARSFARPRPVRRRSQRRSESPQGFGQLITSLLERTLLTSRVYVQQVRNDPYLPSHMEADSARRNW